MDKKYFKILSMTCIILLIYIGWLIFLNLSIVKIEKVPTSLTVVDKKMIGLDINTSSFNFGKVPLGAHSVRNFTITNDYDFKINIKIYTESNFSEWIVLSENNFEIRSGQTKNVQIKAEVPDLAKAGNYGGDIFVKIHRKFI